MEKAEFGSIQLLRSKGEMSVDVRDEHNIMSDGTGTEWNKTSAER